MGRTCSSSSPGAWAASTRPRISCKTRVLCRTSADAFSAPFLFRVATNLLIDHHRRQQHRDTVTLDDPERSIDQADLSPSIERIVWSKQQVARLQQAIEELPPKCRQVFLLIKFHHFTHAEVAATLGIAQSTVVKHMIKAVDFCRTRLDRS
ncbi:MAG: sigma-70 family RNA polymerase sigma factor [Nitrospira sp.]|nr:sigma-70 family RNA polymerase sigma factor [Nitrospira sp.]